MSSPDAPRPTRSRSWTAAAVLLTVVAVALAAVLINAAVSGPATPPAAAPTAPAAPPAAGGGPTAAGADTSGDRPTGCTTTGGAQTVPTSTPTGGTWKLVAGFAVPSTTADGPALKGPAGVAYCFSRTPVGALLAASNLGHVTGPPTQVVAELKDHALVTNQYTDQLTTSATPGGPSPGIQLAGFRIVSYSQDQAVVTLSFAASTGPTPTYAQLTVSLAWSQGDWRVVPQAGPALFINAGSLPSLASFVPWSGVR